MNSSRILAVSKTTILALLAISFLSGFFIQRELQKQNLEDFIKSFKTIRKQNSNYNLIDPLIGTISPPATDVGIFKDIQGQISEYLEKEQQAGRLTDFSFYFRELNSSLWFGIKEDNSFTPASLLKLPIAIAAYKQAENDPNYSLKKKLVYTSELAEFNNSLPTNDKSTLVVGNSYTIEELIILMIEKSDNGAKDLLFTSINQKYFSDFFELVGIDNPFLVSTYEISSEKYSLFLRILYNSSYINEKNSQQLLSLLTKTTFTNGLVAGVPSDIQVAHKFGVYQIDNKIVLHDCGIVYQPEKEFIMCFMTKGADGTNLLKIISNITNMVYLYNKEN